VNANVEDCMAEIAKLNNENKDLRKRIIEQRAKRNKGAITALQNQLARNDKMIDDYDKMIELYRAQIAWQKPHMGEQMVFEPYLSFP
jgi:regulator of replication initiation timing